MIYQIPFTEECKRCTIEIKVSRVTYPIDEAAKSEDDFDTIVTPMITIVDGEVDPCEEKETNYLSGLIIKNPTSSTFKKIATLGLEFQ